MKLRTIKDFNFCNNYDCCIERHERELRAEAIKWVKHKREVIQKAFPDSTEELVRMQGGDLMLFFDLSEEDLK